MEGQSKQEREQNVQLTVDNLFELMTIFMKKGIELKCFDSDYEKKLNNSMDFLNGKQTNVMIEEALNVIIRGYNIVQEQGKYNLMDSFNIVQIIMFIQNNLDKVREKVELNIKVKQQNEESVKGKAKDEENVKGKEKEKNEEDDLSELTEPIPLKGVVNI